MFKYEKYDTYSELKSINKPSLLLLLPPVPLFLILLLLLETLPSIIAAITLPTLPSPGNPLLLKLNMLYNLLLEVNWCLFYSSISLFINSLIELALGLILSTLLAVENVLGQVTVVVNAADLVGVDVFLD